MCDILRQLVLTRGHADGVGNHKGSVFLRNFFDMRERNAYFLLEAKKIGIKAKISACDVHSSV